MRQKLAGRHRRQNRSFVTLSASRANNTVRRRRYVSYWKAFEPHPHPPSFGWFFTSRLALLSLEAGVEAQSTAHRLS